MAARQRDRQQEENAWIADGRTRRDVGDRSCCRRCSDHGPLYLVLDVLLTSAAHTELRAEVSPKLAFDGITDNAGPAEDDDALRLEPRELGRRRGV